MDLVHLRNAVNDVRIRPVGEQQKQVFLHSYLTGVVAAWDAYIKAVIKEYLGKITDPTDVRYSALYDLLNAFALASLEKLNTPNFENTRNVLISTTGYDPFADCVWTVRGLSGLATRERLNEILKVRHSFAHGFPMPSYTWNRSSSGQIRLTVIAVDDCRALLSFLVKKYDRGLGNTMQRIHGIDPRW